MIDLAKAPDPAKMSTDDLLAYLAEVATDLGDALDRADQLYDLRRRIFLAARNRSPRVTLTKLAEVASMGTAAVTQVLHKDRRQQATG